MSSSTDLWDVPIRTFVFKGKAWRGLSPLIDVQLNPRISYFSYLELNKQYWTSILLDSTREVWKLVMNQLVEYIDWYMNQWSWLSVLLLWMDNKCWFLLWNKILKHSLPDCSFKFYDCLIKLQSIFRIIQALPEPESSLANEMSAAYVHRGALLAN